jgi:hypothetical protein
VNQLSRFHKYMANSAGRNGKLFGSHSGRIGGAIGLALQGKTLGVIAVIGRWKSHRTIMNYIKQVRLMGDVFL